MSVGSGIYRPWRPRQAPPPGWQAARKSEERSTRHPDSPAKTETRGSRSVRSRVKVQKETHQDSGGPSRDGNLCLTIILTTSPPFVRGEMGRRVFRHRCDAEIVTASEGHQLRILLCSAPATCYHNVVAAPEMGASVLRVRPFSPCRSAKTNPLYPQICWTFVGAM